MVFTLIDNIVYKVDEIQKGELKLPKHFNKYKLHINANEIVKDHSFIHEFGIEKVFDYEYEFESVDWELLEKETTLVKEGMWVEKVENMFNYIDLDTTYTFMVVEGFEIDDQLYILN